MFRKVIFFCALAMLVKTSHETLEEDIERSINHSNRLPPASLSRKRRYLTFPAGSSLQLVYCLTMPSVGLGAIFTFGLTAALAWELPSEPDELLMSFGKKQITTTTTEAPTTTLPPHHDEEDHQYDLSSIPSQRIGSSHFSDEWIYKNNKYPVSAKTYYDPFRLKGKLKYVSSRYPLNQSKIPFQTTKLKPVQRKSNRQYSSNDNYITVNENVDHTYVHPVFHQLHRRTRRELYGKLEKLLTALNKDGKSCLRKAICEVSQASKEKGTMFQELMKTIFRIKPHDEYPDEDDYDLAYNKNHDCIQKYPKCEHSVWTDMF